jgi:tRNA(Ile)-lysidine synthetase-like protein
MKLARLNGRSRKLSDLYIDRKLPRAARATARVLIDTTRDVIVWAEHVGIADGVDPALVPHLADPPEVFDDIRLCNPS